MGIALVGKGSPPADDRPSGLYLRGVADGRRTRAQGASLDPYLQVGLDDYAKGFRSGYFGKELPEDPGAG